MYNVMNSNESIKWVKPLTLKKNVEISEPTANVCGNSLSMFREYLSSKKKEQLLFMSNYKI